MSRPEPFTFPNELAQDMADYRASRLIDPTPGSGLAEATVLAAFAPALLRVVESRFATEHRFGGLACQQDDCHHRQTIADLEQWAADLERNRR